MIQLDARGDPEFMTSLARGLAVLNCFAKCERPMTIGSASELTGLSRQSVRRCLHTLVQLGYATRIGTSYALRPKVMSLGFAYLSSAPLAVRAQPLLDALRDELGESCSLGVIDEDQVCYIARAEISRIVSVSLRVGSRLPLYPTSMGRVLLAGTSAEARAAYFARIELIKLTERTEISPLRLRGICEKAAEDGYALVNQELEPGLRSVAVPVLSANRRVIAALNVGTSTSRMTEAEVRTRVLPALRRYSAELTSLGLVAGY